ncbi:hypothetical protein D3C80_1800210 [compost metagenome]
MFRANGSTSTATTRFCQNATCSASMPLAARRLAIARRANDRPEANPQSKPTVPWSSRSNDGTTSTRPVLTSASRTHSAA